jgi:hypothetical protein
MKLRVSYSRELLEQFSSKYQSFKEDPVPRRWLFSYLDSLLDIQPVIRQIIQSMSHGVVIVGSMIPESVFILLFLVAT